MSQNQTLMKPVVVGCIAAAIDKFYLQEENSMRSLYFGAAVGAGNYAAEYTYPLIKHIPMPTLSKDLYEGKTLAERIAEVSMSTSMIFVLNRYILKIDIYKDEMMMRMGIIAASDVMGTYICEYIDNQKLEFFTDV
jgi:hypothetical protein